MPNACASVGLASVSTFASTTSPSRAAAASSSSGVSARHGPHHDAQKSTTTGVVRGALDDLDLEVGLADIDDGHRHSL